MAESDCGPWLLEPARTGWVANRADGYRRDRAAILARLDAISADFDAGRTARGSVDLDALRAELRVGS